VRDTIARQFDVDKDSVKYDVEPGSGRYRLGTITFAAKKGKSVDLKKLHESLRETRLGKRTNSKCISLEITAEGDVVVVDKQPRLKVSGTGQEFTLADDPKAKPKEGTKSAYERLKEALAKGEKIARVTGHVQAWSGVWPKVLIALDEKEKTEKPSTKKPELLVVTGFQTVKK
jgi:hypothetical protein